MPAVIPGFGKQKARSIVRIDRALSFYGVAARAYRCVSIMYIWITTSGENVNGTQP